MISGKRFGLGLLRTFFVFCISTVAILTAFNAVFGTSGPLKRELADGNVYSSAATSFIDQATKEGQKEQGDGGGNGGNLDFNNPAIQDAAKQVITAPRLQGYAEQAIDGSYHWLDGTTKTPDFNLDLASLKQDLGASVGGAAVERVKSLPVCTVAQARQLDPANIDPFALPCQPPGINLEAQRQKVEADINTSDAFKDTNITAQDLNSEKTGKDPFQQLSVIPVVFQWSKIAPWILGSLGLATAVALIFLRHDRRQGIKSVAKSLLITGGVLLVVIVLSTVALGKLQPTNPTDNVQLQEAAVTVAKALGSSLNRIFLIFTGVYAALGVAGLVYLHVTKPKLVKDPEEPLPLAKETKAPHPHR